MLLGESVFSEKLLRSPVLGLSALLSRFFLGAFFFWFSLGLYLADVWFVLCVRELSGLGG